MASRAVFALANLRAIPFRTRPVSANDGPSKPAAEMLYGMLQIEFDRPYVNTETACNLVVRQLLDMGGNEHVSPPSRQFRESSFQGLEFKPCVDHDRGVRRLIRDVGDGRNLGRAQQPSLATATIFRNIDGGSKQIVGGTVDRRSVGHSLDFQKRFVQGFARQIRRTKTTCQARRQSLIVGRQCFTQNFST